MRCPLVLSFDAMFIPIHIFAFSCILCVLCSTLVVSLFTRNLVPLSCGINYMLTALGVLLTDLRKSFFGDESNPFQSHTQVASQGLRFLRQKQGMLS